MSYDVRGRKTGVGDPDMGTWSYQYNGLRFQRGRRGRTFVNSGPHFPDPARIRASGSVQHHRSRGFRRYRVPQFLCNQDLHGCGGRIRQLII